MNYQTFEARGYVRFSEEDVFENGCQPDTGTTNYGSDTIVGKTIEDLVNKCQEAVMSDSKEDIILDSCDEIGRLDISIIENADGYKATAFEIARWKLGHIKLYSSIYSFRLQIVTREDVSLLNPYKMTMTKN